MKTDTAATQGWISTSVARERRQRFGQRSRRAGRRRRRSCRAGSPTIRTPTPAVNPTITSSEMKFTSAPMRSAPSAIMISPARNASVSASETYSPDLGPGERAERGEHEQRHGVRGAGHRVPGGAEQRRHRGRHHRAVEAVHGRHAGKRRERDALRQHQDGADQAGDEVRAERAGVDERPPGEEGQEPVPQGGHRTRRYRGCGNGSKGAGGHAPPALTVRPAGPNVPGGPDPVPDDRALAPGTRLTCHARRP